MNAQKIEWFIVHETIAAIIEPKPKPDTFMFIINSFVKSNALKFMYSNHTYLQVITIEFSAQQ